MLKNLFVMLPDAKFELDKMSTVQDEEDFLETIFVPDNIDLNDLLKGEKYFLCGDKGYGKTALLIYLSLIAERQMKALRTFIIFKEYSREERDDFKKLAYITQYDQSEFMNDYDYECVWRWVFHKRIVQTLEKCADYIFKNNIDLENYINMVNSIVLDVDNKISVLPYIIKDGYVEFKADFKPLSASMKLNFERNPTKGTNTAKFFTIVKELDNIFQNLVPAGKNSPPLFIIVDELNLSYMNTSDYQRDMFLIRDLIVSIEYFNRISKLSHKKVIVLGSVRPEVQNAVASKGKEINKILESFRSIIDWTQYYPDTMSNPLIKILIKYLKFSEKKNKIITKDSDLEIYNRWVAPQIHYRDSGKVILDKTLYRPRHIVRLLKNAKELCGNEEKIDKRVLNAISKIYSSACWEEATEELSVNYNQEQLEKIQSLLIGCDSITDKQGLLMKFNSLWPQTERSTAEFDKIVNALYRLGIIGNIYIPGGNQRWYFRGDYNFLPNVPIVINQTFQQQLAIKNVSMKDYVPTKEI